MRSSPLIMVRSRRRALYLVRLRVQAIRARLGLDAWGMDKMLSEGRP